MTSLLLGLPFELREIILKYVFFDAAVNNLLYSNSATVPGAPCRTRKVLPAPLLACKMLFEQHGKLSEPYVVFQTHAIREVFARKFNPQVKSFALNYRISDYCHDSDSSFERSLSLEMRHRVESVKRVSLYCYDAPNEICSCCGGKSTHYGNALDRILYNFDGLRQLYVVVNELITESGHRRSTPITRLGFFLKLGATILSRGKQSDRRHKFRMNGRGPWLDDKNWGKYHGSVVDAGNVSLDIAVYTRKHPELPVAKKVVQIWVGAPAEVRSHVISHFHDEDVPVPPWCD